MTICRVLYDDLERVSEINKFAKSGLLLLKEYDNIEIEDSKILRGVEDQKACFQRLESESSDLMVTLREIIRHQEMDF